MKNEADQKYSGYLKKRSWLGKFYRNKILYPKIAANLDGKVIDIGCGIGDFLNFKKDAIGLDINQQNIDICIGRGLVARLMNVDVLPLADNEVDVVMLDNVLEHMLEPSLLIKEIYRVLNDSGILIIGVPGLAGYKYDIDHKKFYDEHELKLLANENSFEIVKFIYLPLWRSSYLSKYLRQYCVYSIWKPFSE